MSKPMWRLTVERLGKVEQADLRIRPLTLLVGPNNSGKSYLASLLWGLAAMHGDLEAPEGPEREACDALLRLRMGDSSIPPSLSVPPVDQTYFGNLFNATLRAGISSLITRIFNAPNIPCSGVSWTNLALDDSLRLDFNRSGKTRAPALSISYGATPHQISVIYEPAILPWLRDQLMSCAAQGSLRRGFRHPFGNSFDISHPIYLPASRTGFMQLYKIAARRSMRGAFRPDPDEPATLELTSPAFHFIDMLAFGLSAHVHGEYASEADFLERAITGQVELAPGRAANDFLYHPVGASEPLPMKLSSALVTELAPLVLVLRHLSNIPLIVFEEPEAHLHPELQRRVAQVIVRLIRKGVCVWITTHSDYFCQQINNFVKLGALPEEQRAAAQKYLAYESNDYLELDDISGYELRPNEDDQTSHAVEMKATRAGLIMPTFNRSIARIAEETSYLDDLLGQGEC